MLIPVPSLLRSLLSDHLDPGYRGGRRAQGRWSPAPGAVEWGWQVVGGVAVAVVFAVAAVQAQSSAPATRQSQHVLSASVRSAEARTDGRHRQRERWPARSNETDVAVLR